MRHAYCGENPRGAAMMRTPRPEEQLRGRYEPRKFEGKSRLYEQKLHKEVGEMDEVAENDEIQYIIKVHQVDAADA